MSMLGAGGNGMLPVLTDGSQGSARHSTCVLRYEVSGQLQILQDLNKTWLLINRLNVENLSVRQVPEPTASESCYAPEHMARPRLQPEMTVMGAASFLFLMHCCFLRHAVTAVQVTVQPNGDISHHKV